MKTVTRVIQATVVGMLAAAPASAHPGVVGHEHPHESVFNIAFLGLDALAILSLGLFGAAFFTARSLARARARRKK